MKYEQNPERIYAKSFYSARSESDIAHLPVEMLPVALRMIHACAMPEIAGSIEASHDFVASTRSALQNGANIYCDCQMVASAIAQKHLPANNQIISTIGNASVYRNASVRGITRAAAAVELWQDGIADAIILIGNAPTALFRLLEACEDGWPYPASIIGIPVGFVGASESKQALAEQNNIPFLTLHGRFGGSAIAAAALNSLIIGLGGPSGA